MADFSVSLEYLIDKEGGWVDNPYDKGGETYCGITKRWYPKWPGWALIKRMQEQPPQGRDPQLERHLDEAVRDFYRDEYWEAIKGSAIPSQFIADELLEAAVHTTPRTAASWLQISLNCYNRRGKRWPDLKVDGDIGTKTLSALGMALTQGFEMDILAGQNTEQRCYLWGRVKSDPSQEEFVRGWMARAS